MSLHPPLYPLTVLRSSSQRALIRQQTATVHFSELACISATLLRASFLEPPGGGQRPPLEGGTEPPGWGSASPVEERTDPPGWGQSPPGGGGGPSAPSSWVVGAALSASRSFGWSLFSGGGSVFRLLEHGGMKNFWRLSAPVLIPGGSLNSLKRQLQAPY